MSNERDELAELVSCHDTYCYFEDERGSGSECSCGTEICPGLEYAPPAHVGHLTDAILAAGYRKPSQWIPAEHPDGGYKVADEKDIPWLLVNREWLMSEVKRLTPRTVTTAEALDALPVGSVVLGFFDPPAAWQKDSHGFWWCGTEHFRQGKTSGRLAGTTRRGLTVLHVGGER
jgi:hypothetical protein